jgi:hypothetical protein
VTATGDGGGDDDKVNDEATMNLVVQSADAKQKGSEREDEGPGVRPRIRQRRVGERKRRSINSIETHIGVPIYRQCFSAAPYDFG